MGLDRVPPRPVTPPPPPNTPEPEEINEGNEATDTLRNHLFTHQQSDQSRISNSTDAFVQGQLKAIGEQAKNKNT